MSSAELPDADVIEQHTLVDDAEDREDDLKDLGELPHEADAADAVEQHRSLGGDTEDYPRD